MKKDGDRKRVEKLSWVVATCKQHQVSLVAIIFKMQAIDNHI